MKLYILILCLMPMLALGAVQLNFEDGSNLCGNYIERDAAYCKMMQAGDFCIQKSEIASRQTVSDCDEIAGTGESTGYLKQRMQTQADLLAKKRAQEGSDDEYYYRAPAKKAVKMRREY